MAVQRVAPSPFPPTLVVTPISRRPTTLPDDTVRTVLGAPIPAVLACPLVDGPPRASVVVVTYDNLAFTRMCLESLLANTEGPNYEVIVVDNASTDGTPEYLRELAQLHLHVRLVLNDHNLGFAPANNQGLVLARGDVLALLNNDTIVPPGWLSGLVRHLDDPAVGSIGPVTNRIGNEAQIDAAYDTYGELLDFARHYTHAHQGVAFDIRTLTMFCLAMRRDVYERVGLIDESYRIGMLEDDDYSMRVRAAGYRVMCADDVFVHHFGEASFGKLVPTGEYGEVLEANQQRFKEKWGSAWEPYKRRYSERYQEVAERIRTVARDHTPPGATIAVVSRGDETLLNLGGRSAWHFPRLDDGTYAGAYPAHSDQAISLLEDVRAKGAQFLIVPSSAFWWLEHYADFGNHLEHNHHLAYRDDACAVFMLRGPREDHQPE